MPSPGQAQTPNAPSPSAAPDPAAPLARELAPATTLATLPPGTFLENLLVEADGAVLFTSYLAREVLRWRAGSGVTTEARLSGHPVSLSADTDGTLYAVVHGQSFRQGAAMLESQQVWRLGAGGAAALVANLPEARFLNGMAWLAHGRFLIADSLAGKVWLFDTRTARATPWLAHADLESALPQRLVPGANGIHIVGNDVWISNSSKRLLLSVALLPDGTAGAVRRRVEGLPIDDFAVAADGSVYAATHRQQVLRLRPDGGAHTVVAESAEVNDSTALRFGRTAADREQLYVVTSGGAFAGRSEPAYLSRLAVGQVAAAERAPARQQQNADQRVVVALRVDEAAVQRWLPAPWRVAPQASGPSQGANLSLLFVDRLWALDAQGGRDAGAVERSLVITVPARHPGTGELATFPIRAYSDTSGLVPGPYGTSLAARVERQSSSQRSAPDAAEGVENWQIHAAAGGSLTLALRARLASPNRVSASATLRSPVVAGLSRTYLFEQGADVLKSALPNSADRLSAISLRSDIAELAALLDGREQVLSVTLVPWYLRQVFVP